MGRGILTGTIWGVIVGVVVLIGASQLAQWRDLGLPSPQAAETRVPDATEFAEVRKETDPVAPEPEMRPPQGHDAPTPTPASDDPAPLVNAAPLGAPVSVSDAPPTPDAPDAAQAPIVASAPDAGVSLGSESGLTAPPEGEAPLTAGLDAPAPRPEPEIETDVAQPEVASAATTPPENAGMDAQGGSEDVASLATDAPEAPAMPPSSEAEVPSSAPAPVADAGPAADAPETSSDASRSATLMPRVIDRTQGGALPGQRAAGLPGAGATAAPDPDVTAAAVPAALAPAAQPQDGALARFRSDFEPSGDRPLVSIIVVADAARDIPAEALARLPFPVSVAIDATAADAGDLAEVLGAAGIELLLVPALPPGATPADVEQALQINLAAVPGTVAFLDPPEDGRGGARMATAQLVAAAGASGHGMISLGRGLNTAERLAARAGVPHGTVTRDLDPAGEDARTIARALDQAAFRARQEGEAILLARARETTLTALGDWASGLQAQTVDLAPVSALIAPTGTDS